MPNSCNDHNLRLRVNAMRYAARDILIVEFGHPAGCSLPSGSAGSHVDVTLPNGLTRQYSLIETVRNQESYKVAVKREPNGRGGSAYIHDQLRVGHLVGIGIPRNNFPLDEQASHVVLVAGGIGITPIWCMVQRLVELRKSWEIHYSCRSRIDAAFLSELTQLRSAQFHFDDEKGGQLLNLCRIVAEAPKGSHFYCCGPKPMLKAFEEATIALPPESVHVEYFSSPNEAAITGGYTVELAKTGRAFTIPAGSTILEVLREAGVAVSFSCEEGVCGACETKVLSGIPDHRDSILGAKERAQNKTMMICCSGSRSDKLILDL